MNTRSMVIAGCGLLLGLISVILIGFTIRTVTPRTLSLAYRIDTGRTVFFVRTTDRASFERAVTAYAPMVPALRTQLTSLPRGVSYEFALLSGVDSDQLEWIIEVHTKNQRQRIIVSTEDPEIFLDVRDIDRSLGRSSAFLESKRNAANLAFIDLSHLPLAGSAAILARSIVARFQNAVITWDRPRGQLNIQKKEKTVFAPDGPTADLLSLTSAPPAVSKVELPAVSKVEPLLSIAISDPHAILTVLAKSLQEQDGPLYDGLKGIMSLKLENSAHRTDLASAADNLLSKPTRLLITEKKKEPLQNSDSTKKCSRRQGRKGTSQKSQDARKQAEILRDVSAYVEQNFSAVDEAACIFQRFQKDELRFVVTGHAKDKQLADRWIEDLRSATTQARVRTQEFFKENSRRDVIADPSAYENKTVRGWTMTTIGSGSSRPFTIAGKGDQIALSNDPALLMMAIDHLDHPAGISGSGPRSFEGTVDIPWLTKTTEEWLPFLASDFSSLTSALFGPDVNRVDWTATDGASSVTIRFRNLKTSFEL